MTAANTAGAAMINAAVIAAASTMTGQLAGGASFDDALQAGLKAGAASAMTAGILNTPIIDGGTQGMQSINQLANVQTTGANIVGTFSADTLGQNLAGMAVRGVVNAGVNSAIYGGSFGESFKSSFVSDLAAVGANAVGLSTETQSPGNVLGHAAVGAVAAQLKGQDAVSGAIGGAGSALVNPLLDQAIGGTDGSGWGSDLQTAQQWQSATLQLASLGVSAGIASALGKDGMTAATAAQNETVNNYLTKNQIEQKQKALAAAKTDEDIKRIQAAYDGIDKKQAAEAKACLSGGDCTSVMTNPDTLKIVLNELQASCAAPHVCSEHAQKSIKELQSLVAQSDALLPNTLLEETLLGGKLLGALTGTAARVLGSVNSAGIATAEGTANVATASKLADNLASNMSKPIVADTKLGGLMDDLYRDGAKIGTGSTADAVRYETATGNSVGGVFHTQKAQDYSTALQKWLDSNPSASFSDRSAAQNVLRDIQNALKGK